MEERELKLSYALAFSDTAELSKEDAELIAEAKGALKNAYAPYSNFQVAATILLANGKTVTGTNRRMRPFPRALVPRAQHWVLLGPLPNVAIKKIAITVKSGTHVVKNPTAPCGICRQRIFKNTKTGLIHLSKLY